VLVVAIERDMNIALTPMLLAPRPRRRPLASSAPDRHHRDPPPEIHGARDIPRLTFPSIVARRATAAERYNRTNASLTDPQGANSLIGMTKLLKAPLNSSDRKRILVTGGLGAVGVQLVPELRSRGHDVWILDRLHSDDSQYLRADVGEYRQFENAVSRAEPQYVFHLAAEFGRWNGEDFYETLWRSNVIGNKHLIRLQEQFGFRTIFFSSSEVYGDWPNVMAEDIMDEEEIKQLNDYAISKWAGELQHLNARAMAGLETVRVRLFNVYGPGEYYSPYRSALCRFLYSGLRQEKFVVYRGHSRSWLYVTDAVRSLANIIDNFQGGEVYNIADGTEYTMDDVAELVKEALNVPSSLIEYRDGEPFTTRTKHVDISKAVRDLGHEPKMILQLGIERTIEWLRQIYLPAK